MRFKINIIGPAPSIDTVTGPSERPPRQGQDKSLLVGNKYRIGKKIANGSFGEMRLAKNMQNGETLIVKMEPLKAKVPTLQVEFTFYNMLGVHEGNKAVKCYTFFVILTIF